ncbi:MAG TPA: hypothetical protein VIY48_03540 [Candidatus Paceibacterota bacterium]
MNITNFDIAKNIAYWATILDESKKDYPESLRYKALACADQMHQMANALAGVRGSEIYYDDRLDDEYLTPSDIISSSA